MEFNIREIGRLIVELSVKTISTRLVEDVCDTNGKIDEDLIENMENVLNIMKEHNQNIN